MLPSGPPAGKGSLRLLRTWHTGADGSRRAYYKEFLKVVAAADVIIEVLDARDPLGSRCQDVERFVRQAGADKKVILLLNKIGVSRLLLASTARCSAFFGSNSMPSRESPMGPHAILALSSAVGHAQ